MAIEAKKLLTIQNLKTGAIFGIFGFLAYVLYLMFTSKIKFPTALTLGKNQAKKIINAVKEKAQNIVKPQAKSQQKINIGKTPIKSGIESKTTLLSGYINNSYDEDLSVPSGAWGL